VLVAVLGACDPPQPPATVAEPATAQERPGRTADFGAAAAPADVRTLVNLVVAADDHGGRPFAAIDKKNARIYVFSAEGRLIDSAPVLVGLAPGDATVPGIGSKAIADVQPEERTTPAGRFVTMPGKNSLGDRVVWIDYDAAVAMHVVVTGVAAERRLERLASPDPAQHRISYGCINLPAAFFEKVAAPAFATRGGIIYILPDTRRLDEVFPALTATTTDAKAAPLTRAAAG
jgi:hypothetical protein